MNSKKYRYNDLVVYFTFQIEHLAAIDYNMKKFMYGVIETLFGYEFFMKKTSWKKESEKVLLKDSEIVKCWIGNKCVVEYQSVICSISRIF